MPDGVLNPGNYCGHDLFPPLELDQHDGELDQPFSISRFIIFVYEFTQFFLQAKHLFSVMLDT